MARIRLSRPRETERLFEIWRAAVAATHFFVTTEDLETFTRLVRDDYIPNTLFWVVVDAGNRPLGFMGMTGAKMDSLFIDPEHHGQGLGTALVEHARALFPSLTVDVNEQNGPAVAFYEGLGFRRVGRSPVDDTGRFYPVLHMRLN